MAGNELDPPFYLLLAQSQLPVQPASAPVPTTLCHPVIQYHFADDPVHAILPASDAETVIILDFNPAAQTPVAQSLRKTLAVSSVKVMEAPGAAVAAKDEPKRNNKMYIVETVATADEE